MISVRREKQHQRHPVAVMQLTERRARRGRHFLERPAHAAADVEQQQQIERLRFALEMSDRAAAGSRRRS